MENKTALQILLQRLNSVKSTQLCSIETIKGKDLEFISWIKRDGSGTAIVEGEWHRYKGYPKPMDDEDYNVLPLSLSKQTYIAHGFNSWVVKLKNQPQ